jgi:DNA (cytosine-5)-methyltransferase 1
MGNPVSRPRLLDLFCGAGGAAMGYHRAGFDVVGIDIEPQPRYPFDFHQGDAMTWRLDEYDVITASPPCHDHSPATGRSGSHNRHGTGWMLAATIDRLAGLSIPWVVENVDRARFAATVYRFRLCGSSFGLDVRRHRWFATNTAVLAPPCAHHWQTPRFRATNRDHPAGYLSPVVHVTGHPNHHGDAARRATAMGIDWMTSRELTQAIPPDYTEWIGRRLIESITAVQTYRAVTLGSRGQGDPATAGRSQVKARPRHQGVLHPGMPAG